MASTVFPAPSAGGGAALPQGAVANVASGYAATGGWKYATSTAAGTYQVNIQAPSSNLYGIETANGISVSDIKGGDIVPLKTTATEASITVGSYYPYEVIAMTSINGTIRNVNAGNGLHIMVSNTGYLYTSTDSLTWTNRTSGGEGTGQSNYAAGYVNDRWIIPGWGSAATNGRGLLYSTNGITWSTLSLASVHDTRTINVAYGNGVWVAICAYGGGTTGQIATSTDFTTWTGRSGPTTNAPQCITYVNYEGTYYFLIGCSGGVIFYSDSGTSWTSAGNMVNGSTVNAIVHDGIRTIAFGTTNVTTTVAANIAYLVPDGSAAPTSWNSTTFTTNAYALGTNFGTGGFVLGTFIMYANSIGNTGATSIVSDGGVGSFKCFTSTDGFTWTMRSTPLTTRSGGPLTGQANGVVAFGASSRLYATTAYNSAAIHINSTALTSV